MMPIGPLMVEHRWIERVIADLQLRLGGQAPEKAIDPTYVEHVVDFLRTYADRCHHGKEAYSAGARSWVTNHERVRGVAIPVRIFSDYI